MNLDAIRSPLYDQAGDAAAGGGGAAARLDPAIEKTLDDKINAAFARLVKTDLPKVFGAQLEAFSEKLSDKFIERLQEQLPSEEEIAAEQARVAAAGGAAAGDAGAGAGGAAAGGAAGAETLPPQVRAQLLKYEKDTKLLNDRLIALETERTELSEQAEYSDRVAQIQASLNSYPFASDNYRKLAEQHALMNIERAEDGSLVADGLPVKEWVDREMGGMAALLQPKNVSGSGASSPGGLHRGGAAAAVPVPTLEQITADADPKTLATIRQHAVAQLTGTALAPPK